MTGAADLLADDLRGTDSSLITIADDAAVQCRFRGKINSLRAISSYRSVGIVLDSVAVAVPDLTAVQMSLEQGVLSSPEIGAAVRFRVQLPGDRHRNTVIAAVREQTGWINDPTDWDINLRCRNGQWIAEIGYLHYSHRIGRLRRQPWSTNPVLAAILVRLAKIKSDQLVHDPFCGTGTLLIAARQANATIRLSGTDHDHRTLQLARANLRDRATPAALADADAIPFPAADGTIHRVLSNLPFGKQVGSHDANASLYPALISEIARTLQPSGRAVLLTEDKRLLVDAVARTPGVKIIRERLLRYGGATPTAYVISRTRLPASDR
ncbi:MAG TPA: methyltransferase [Microlunatus sp.]